MVGFLQRWRNYSKLHTLSRKKGHRELGGMTVSAGSRRPRHRSERHSGWNTSSPEEKRQPWIRSGFWRRPDPDAAGHRADAGMGRPAPLV